MVTFYELSAAADQDIQDIYDYAAQEYGEDQAESYTLELEVFLDELVRSPEMGRRRDDIRPDCVPSPKAITLSSTVSFRTGFVSCASCTVAGT